VLRKKLTDDSSFRYLRGGQGEKNQCLYAYMYVSQAAPDAANRGSTRTVVYVNGGWEGDGTMFNTLV